jgi:hypothetical protein
MPLTKIKSLGITDGTITSADLAAGVGGKVLQVVSVNPTGTSTSTSTNSYVDISGFSATITPSSTSNKILIMFSVHGSIFATGGWGVRLVDGSNNLIVEPSPRDGTGPYGTYIGPNGQLSGIYNYQYLWSSSTTSATTVKLQGRPYSGTEIRFNETSASNNSVGSFTLMEISA